jgi:2',3'-cyclic-nucleotide 2'-phosphodiesterase (5'-nucleotidase family)
MRMQIADKKATEITIAGRPLDANAQYVIALPDYIANGGDDASMLKGLPRQDKGIVYRDELLAYFTQVQKEGKTISSSIEGRVTNN